ncbi:MAG: helix-turn-helix domain-containing protein [Muribaculaceae bacterium]
MKAPLIFLSLLSGLLFSCTAGSGESAGDCDTTFTAENIQRQAMVDPQQALALLDSAEALRAMNIIDINGLRALIYHNVYDMTNVALAYSSQVYKDATLQADTVAQIKALKQLVALNYMLSHYSHALSYATRGLDIIADTDAGSQAYFLQFAGLTKAETESVDAGLEYLNRSIDIYATLARDNGGADAADDRLYACMQKANTLQSHNCFSQALEVLPQCNSAFDALVACNDANPQLVDHRRAEVLAINMLVLYKCGEADRAAECYKQYTATTYGNTPGGSDLVVPYLIASQQYDEALSRLDTEQARLAANRDTISDYYVNTVLDGRLQCLQAQGQWRQALAVSKQIKALTDSLYLRENAHQMAEQSIIYKTKDYELQMIEQQRKLTEQRDALIVGSIILAILLALAAVLFYYNRTIRRKNRAAAALIEELTATHSLQRQILIQESTTAVDPAADDQSLFAYLNRRITADKLYLQPNFHREDAAALANVPLKRLSAIFRQFANGFPGYINDLRLEHSVHLLRTKDNYTVEGIAQECGFSNRQTFHRLFVEKYAMTPAEFRRSALPS